MTNKIYACIKDGIVVNTAIFDNPSEELLSFFIADQGLDAIVAADNAAIGYTYDGNQFLPPVG